MSRHGQRGSVRGAQRNLGEMRCEQTSKVVLKGYPEYADSEMQQALVVILLELRKTPRPGLGRFSVMVFQRNQNPTLTHV